MSSVFLFIGILYFIPFVSLWSYYFYLRVREYLIGSIIFFSLFLNGLIIHFLGFGTVLELVTVFIAMILVVIVSKRILAPKYWNFYLTILGTIIIMIIGNFMLLSSVNGLLIAYRIICFEIARFSIGLFLYIAYSQIDLVVINSRTTLVKATWKYSGAILSIVSLLRILDLIRYLVFTEPPYDPFSHDWIYHYY